MPIFGEKQRFTRRYVASTPDQPGVYALFGDDGVAYYGCTRGSETIRSRLDAHLWGQAQPGRDTAKWFSFEITRFPLSRESKLLEEHVQEHWDLPVYNRAPTSDAIDTSA